MACVCEVERRDVFRLGVYDSLLGKGQHCYQYAHPICNYFCFFAFLYLMGLVHLLDFLCLLQVIHFLKLNSTNFLGAGKFGHFCSMSEQTA